jgi:hypothetical protein
MFGSSDWERLEMCVCRANGVVNVNADEGGRTPDNESGNSGS